MPANAKSRLSTKNKLRSIFSPKSKPSPAVVISHPTRLGSNKRAFREVSPDENEPAPSASRARPRQRVSSTGSAATVRLRSSPSTSTLRAKDKSIDVGRAAPAQPALSNTTSHNYVPSVVHAIGITISPLLHTHVAAPSTKSATAILNKALAHSAKRQKSPRRSPSARGALSPADNEYVSDGSAGQSPIAAASATEFEFLNSVKHVGDKNGSLDARHRFDKADAVVSTTTVIATSATPSSISERLHALADAEDAREVLGVRRSPKSSFSTKALPTRYTRTRAALKQFVARIDTKHATLWDMDFADIYTWVGQLHLTDTTATDDPSRKCPSIYGVEIDCHTVNPSEPGPKYPIIDFGKLRTKDGAATANDGIYVSKYWRWVSDTSDTGSWVLDFSVPIPVLLFSSRECLKLRLKAKIDIGSEEGVWAIVHTGAIEMTVSYLQREREMERRLSEEPEN